MTSEERRIAVAALGGGPWAKHEQVVIAVADALKLERERVEAVLKQLSAQQVLNRVSYRKDSVYYEEGVNWTDEE